MNFKITALQASEFAHLFQLSDSDLKTISAIRMVVDEFPGYPCRVCLQDAAIGEEVILLPYQHHITNSPYQASGPIFVRKLGETADLKINQIPKMFNHRLLSIRGFDSNGIMKGASVTEGHVLKAQIIRFFENPEINYLHIHNAKPGCFNCLVKRA